MQCNMNQLVYEQKNNTKLILDLIFHIILGRKYLNWLIKHKKKEKKEKQHKTSCYY